MVDLTNYSLFSFSLTSLCHKTQWKTFAPFSPWSQHLPCSFLPLSPCSLISVLPPLLLWSLMHINASTYVELWKLVPWSLWFSTSNQCLESCTSSCFQNLECLLTVLVLAKAHSSFQLLLPTAQQNDNLTLTTRNQLDTDPSRVFHCNITYQCLFLGDEIL